MSHEGCKYRMIKLANFNSITKILYDEAIISFITYYNYIRTKIEKNNSITEFNLYFNKESN